MDPWLIQTGDLEGYKTWLLTVPAQPQSPFTSAGKDWDPLHACILGGHFPKCPTPKHIPTVLPSSGGWDR